MPRILVSTPDTFLKFQSHFLLLHFHFILLHLHLLLLYFNFKLPGVDLYLIEYICFLLKHLFIYLDFPDPLHHIKSHPGEPARFRATVHNRPKTGHSNLNIPEAERNMYLLKVILLFYNWIPPVVSVEKEQRST